MPCPIYIVWHGICTLPHRFVLNGKVRLFLLFYHPIIKGTIPNNKNLNDIPPVSRTAVCYPSTAPAHCRHTAEGSKNVKT